MPFNGSGIYNLPVTTVTPAVAGTTIDDAEFNTFTADLKDALTNCIVKDGQTVSPTLTTPSIVTPTISGSPVFTGNPLIEKADPQISIKCADEATENTIIRFQDETNVARALLYRPAGTDKVRLDARDSLGAVQAAIEVNETGTVDITVGTFTATAASLTTPALTNATGSLSSPVINTGVSGTAGVSRMIQDTVQATTSGSTIDFTSIPSWVKRITVIPDNVSGSGTGFMGIQIGDSGGLETTAYESVVSTITVAGAISGPFIAGSQFLITRQVLAAATSAIAGSFVLVNVTGNVWAGNGVLVDTDGSETFTAGGRKSLSATLDRLSLIISAGTFDAGQVNIIYEG